MLPDGTVRQVYFYCVDVSEFVVNKLADRGSLSARGIVTNVQDFVVNLQKGLATLKDCWESPLGFPNKKIAVRCAHKSSAKGGRFAHWRTERYFLRRTRRRRK